MKSKILFVGDSITHGTDWFPRIDFAEVANIAVPGYSTDEVTGQLAQIRDSGSTVISMLVGTNDFGIIELDRAGVDVGRRVVAIVDSIVNQSSDVHVVLNSILPRSVQFSDRIAKANFLIASYSHERVHYLDCWPALSRDNYLRPEFLVEDGFDVHLSEDGYDAWAEVLIPTLRQLTAGRL